jgi:hypothetical protein
LLRGGTTGVRVARLARRRRGLTSPVARGHPRPFGARGGGIPSRSLRVALLFIRLRRRR